MNQESMTVPVDATRVAGYVRRLQGALTQLPPGTRVARRVGNFLAGPDKYFATATVRRPDGPAFVLVPRPALKRLVSAAEREARGR